MAADINEITESNQEYPTVAPFREPELADIEAELRIIHTETHRALQILEKIERELDEWRPVIEQYRGLAPAGMFMAARRARRNAIQEDGNGQVPHT